MDEELPINLPAAVLARRLIAVAVILFVSVSCIYGSRNKKISVIEPPVISKTVPARSLVKKNAATLPEKYPNTAHGHKQEHFFHPIIVQVADHHELDPALIKAIIMAESGYNPRAVSKKGARGLMQLMPGTAEALGVEDSFNPEQNIRGGVKYFKQLVNQFQGDVTLALAAYNAGSKNVRKYQGIPPWKSTQYYIDKVFKYYQIYKNHPTGRTDRT